MDFKIGDYVTRTSYNNDLIFIIIDIQDNEAILKGYEVRLIADSPLEDLNIYNQLKEDEEIIEDDISLSEEENVGNCNNL